MTDTADLRLLTDLDEAGAAAALFDEIWNADGVMPRHLVRTIQHAGGYVAGAFVDGELVAASVGFLGQHVVDGRRVPTLHSHITGVREGHRGLGTALKHHQRAWCADVGVEAITWTFDPLVARNAYFNVHKLGATATAYLTNHYGEMTDGINAGGPSDRLFVWWPVRPSPAVVRDLPVVTLLDRTDGGAPVLSPGAGAASAGTGATLAVRVPADIETMRLEEPELARRWRLALRTVMAPALTAGHAVVDVRRDGTYLLQHPATDGGTP